MSDLTAVLIASDSVLILKLFKHHVLSVTSKIWEGRTGPGQPQEPGTEAAALFLLLERTVGTAAGGMGDWQTSAQSEPAWLGLGLLSELQESECNFPLFSF